MKKNMGAIDRVVRLLLAAAGIALVALKIVAGGWAIAIGVVALVFIATGVIGFCPIYEPFGIKTCKVVNPAEVGSTQMFDADGEAPNKPK